VPCFCTTLLPSSKNIFHSIPIIVFKIA
jgi:hypothetical protein